VFLRYLFKSFKHDALAVPIPMCPGVAERAKPDPDKILPFRITHMKTRAKKNSRGSTGRLEAAGMSYLELAGLP
jgi:hypothetical protein